MTLQQEKPLCVYCAKEIDIDNQPREIAYSEIRAHKECFIENAVSVKIPKMTAQDVHKPISVKGIIMEKTPEKFITIASKFECPSCGNTISILQKENYKQARCRCGRKGLRKIDDEIAKFCELTIKDGESKLKVKTFYELAEKLKLGERIKVLGVLYFERQEARNKISLEVEPVINPVSIRRLKKEGFSPASFLKEIDGFQFQKLVEMLLVKKGIKAMVSKKKTGDGGVDIIAIMDEKQVPVQCKHQLGKTIASPDMDNLLGVMTKNNALKGLFVCTGKYSQQAKETAQNHNIELWDYDKVIQEMRNTGSFLQEDLQQPEVKELEIQKPEPNERIFDIDKIATERSPIMINKIEIMKEILQELEVKIGKMVSIEDVKKSALDKDIIELETEELIQKLKRSGDVYEPKRGFISRI